MESLRFLTVMLSTILSGTVVDCEGSVVLTQTHPAAPYVCRTGNITLRCQYDGVGNVLVVLWSIGGRTTSNASNTIGHTALPRTTTYQELVVDSYTNLAAVYGCIPTLTNGTLLQSNPYNPQYEYGTINVTQPADSDTSHTLTSLQPGTTYRIEVEAVRKEDGPGTQKAKIIGYFTIIIGSSKLCKCEEKVEQNILYSTKASMTYPQTTVTVLSVLLSLVLTLSLSTCAVSAVVHAVMYKRLQRCRAELRGGGGDSVKAGPEGEGPPTRKEEEEEKMQANPAYLPIEMSYKSQESKYINVPR